MTILTSAPSPSTLFSPSTSSPQVRTLLSPALSNAVHFATTLQKFLGATTLFLLWRSYLLTDALFRRTRNLLRTLAVQSYYTAKTFTWHVLRSGKQAVRRGWRATEPVRNKIFFEFMVFVLGGGNGLILVLFWPGWLIIGGGFWGIWKVCG